MLRSGLFGALFPRFNISSMIQDTVKKRRCYYNGTILEAFIQANVSKRMCANVPLKHCIDPYLGEFHITRMCLNWQFRARSDETSKIVNMPAQANAHAQKTHLVTSFLHFEFFVKNETHSLQAREGSPVSFLFSCAFVNEFHNNWQHRARRL